MKILDNYLDQLTEDTVNNMIMIPLPKQTFATQHYSNGLE